MSRHQFPRRIDALAEVFSWLREFAAERAINPAIQLELGVITEELFSNQIRHATPGTESIGLELSIETDRIRLQITDRDVDEFDPTSQAPKVDVDAPAEQRTPGGLGLHLVRQMTDGFDYAYDQARRESRITVTRLLER